MKSIFLSLLAASLLPACAGRGEASASSEELPPIFPDYVGVTVPRTIAPLNFLVEGAEALRATILDASGREALRVEGDGDIRWPLDRWQELLAAGHDSLSVRLEVWDAQHPDGIAYRPFTIYLSSDPIDSHIVYRLIEPGYEPWHKMGIYQRSLSSWDEEALVTNHEDNGVCINCHTPLRQSPSTYLYHRRGPGGGTVIVRDGEETLINLKETGPGLQGVYPAWHPDGRYVAFSSNATHQSFFSQGEKALEVYDLSSELILLDTDSMQVLTDERFTEPTSWETFPSWSPDGRQLYFCTAPADSLMPHGYTGVKYAIVRVDFDPSTATFGEQVDTIYHPAYSGGSASMPRLSPDGRYLLFTEAACGTFPIWHSEADLRILDLQAQRAVDTRRLNSSEAESFHSWSSNGRWILFTSRRMDGRHTRLYIAHMSEDGEIGRPFMLPQRVAADHYLRQQSFNAPDFVSGRGGSPGRP